MIFSPPEALSGTYGSYRVTLTPPGLLWHSTSPSCLPGMCGSCRLTRSPYLSLQADSIECFLASPGPAAALCCPLLSSAALCWSVQSRSAWTSSNHTVPEGRRKRSISLMIPPLTPPACKPLLLPIPPGSRAPSNLHVLLTANPPASPTAPLLTDRNTSAICPLLVILFLKGKVPPGCNLGPKSHLVPSHCERLTRFDCCKINIPITSELESHTIHYMQWLGLLFLLLSPNFFFSKFLSRLTLVIFAQSRRESGVWHLISRILVPLWQGGRGSLEDAEVHRGNGERERTRENERQREGEREIDTEPAEKKKGEKEIQACHFLAYSILYIE